MSASFSTMRSALGAGMSLLDTISSSSRMRAFSAVGLFVFTSSTVAAFFSPSRLMSIGARTLGCRTISPGCGVRDESKVSRPHRNMAQKVKRWCPHPRRTDGQRRETGHHLFRRS